MSPIQRKRSFPHQVSSSPVKKPRNNTSSCWVEVPEYIQPKMTHHGEYGAQLHKIERTVVTPTVAAIAQDFFVQNFQVVGRKSLREVALADFDADSTGPPKAHYIDPSRIEWVENSRTVPDYYNSVLIDGVSYSAGDYVLVEKGEDNNRTRARNAASEQARSNNWLANSKWFCKIVYMYEQRDTAWTKRGETQVIRKFFHAQWLQHGSQTILQEAAHSNGLFYLNECDNLPLECIFSKCSISILNPGEGEPPDEPGDHFHVRFTWDPHRTTFYEFPRREQASLLAQCEPWKQCYPCALERQRQTRTAWTRIRGDGLSRHGIDYHINDFVYLIQPTCDLYDIGQIIQILPHEDMPKHLIIQRYRRHIDLKHLENSSETGALFMDDRRLVQTDDFDTVSLDYIDGKPHVFLPTSENEREMLCQQDDTFYVDLVVSSDGLEPLTVLPQCKHCSQQLLTNLDIASQLLDCHGSLKGLELFSGAGGLSTGLELSEFVETKWAVEWSSSAALTYSKNHPTTTVYNQDTNVLLQRAIETHEGIMSKSLKAFDGTTMPPMPKQGQVDFIYGGPPCQSFSLMNHHRRVDDIRSTLICNFLSFVEFYRPSFFLIENVGGLISFKLCSEQSAGQAMIGGIKMGVVKFILRTATSLGYQISLKVLEAGQYGAPQSRKRVIFWAAKQGVPLPSFPQPTHCFPGKTYFANLSNGERLPPLTRAQSDSWSEHSEIRGDAPFKGVTVYDAIGDLPRFDWINPFVKIPKTPQEWEEIGSRLGDGIRRFSAVKSDNPDTFPGYVGPVRYQSDPLNRYQLRVRQKTQNTVTHHYTRRFIATTVESVCRIPLRPNANHVDLPSELKSERWYTDKGTPRSDYSTIYGRIDGNSMFRTALTTVDPNAKGGQILHPDQKRILTVRECARAQGFPDHYEFHSVSAKPTRRIADYHRQIGNAVPVQLAHALGKELGKALVKWWQEQEREE